MATSARRQVDEWGLTVQQRKWADHYLLYNNKTEAYQHAYPGAKLSTAQTGGSKLSKKIEVQSYIRYRLDQVSKKVSLSKEWVLNEMFNLAKSNAHEFMTRDGKIKNIKDLDYDVAAAIKSVEVDENTLIGKKKTKITLHDKTKNLDNLGRHFNIYKEEIADGAHKFVSYDVRISRGPREE